jgi:DNA-binding response OmpR family regulator
MIKLRAKEFALLEFFMRNADRVVDADEHAEGLGINYEPATNVIDVYVSSLRRRSTATSSVRSSTRWVGIGLPVRRAGCRR